MYVQVKGTEDVIEIDVDKNRPKSFASKQEANLWEEKTLREILKFKKLVEEGKYVPEEVVQRLEAKPNKTEEELEIIEKWKHVKLDRKEKIEWLKTEASLAQSDLGMILSFFPSLKTLEILLIEAWNGDTVNSRLEVDLVLFYIQNPVDL